MGAAERDADQRRWGLLRNGLSRWGEHDPRFDAGRHPNEFHRFGWIVEIDPYDPAAMPVSEEIRSASDAGPDVLHIAN